MCRLWVLYLVLASIACGPSLAQLHASDQAYESCYAADFEPSVDTADRARCWREWLDRHAAHQPPERVAFARERVDQLRTEPSTRALPSDAPASIVLRDHEYPPASPGNYHTSGCDPLCQGQWDQCNRQCDLDNQPCKTACENEFRVCTSGCP